MTVFPGPLLRLDDLAVARERYGRLLTEAATAGRFTSAWEDHRPTLTRLSHADATYALPFLARLQLADPDNWVLIDDREAAYPQEAMMAALAGLVGDYRSTFGEGNFFLPIVEGICAYVDGFEHAAFEAFATVGGEPHLYDVVKDDFAGAACARPLLSLRGVQAFRGEAGFPEVEIVYESPVVEPSLISITMDALYLRAFSPAWLAVLEELRPHRVGGHFHLVARTEDELKLLDRVADWSRTTGVSCVLTQEVVQPTDRAYFTIRRFFAAQTVMARWSASLLVLDADLAVEDPGFIAGLFARDEGVSIALSSGPWHGYLPWRRVSGGAVLLPAGDATQRYLQLVTDHIEYFWLANETRHWWVDQLALECARLACVKQWPSSTFRDFGESIWTVLLASEEYKISQLKKLPEVAASTAQGADWNSALRQLQIGL